MIKIFKFLSNKNPEYFPGKVDDVAKLLVYMITILKIPEVYKIRNEICDNLLTLMAGNIESNFKSLKVALHLF